MQRSFILVLSILLLVFAADCSGTNITIPDAQPPDDSVSPTRTPFLPISGTLQPTWIVLLQTTPQMTPPNVPDLEAVGYPETPEKVAQAFLIASQVEPLSMNQYLGQSLVARLDGKSPLTLLDFDSNIEGFALQSGSVSLEQGSASVNFGLQIAGEITQRKLNLVMEDGHWVITGIEVY